MKESRFQTMKIKEDIEKTWEIIKQEYSVFTFFISHVVIHEIFDSTLIVLPNLTMRHMFLKKILQFSS